MHYIAFFAKHPFDKIYTNCWQKSLTKQVLWHWRIWWWCTFTLCLQITNYRNTKIWQNNIGKRPSLFTYPGYPKHYCKRKYSRHKTESEKSTVAAAGNQCGSCAAVCAHCRPKGLQWILNGLKAIWVHKDHSERAEPVFRLTWRRGFVLISADCTEKM